jgi:hypothetical protein
MESMNLLEVLFELIVQIYGKYEFIGSIIRVNCSNN